MMPALTLSQREILDAAAQLFRENGFPGTNIKMIGQKLNLTSAALYYHFPTKDSILKTVMTDGIEQVGNAVRNAMASVDQEPRNYFRIRAGLRAHVVASLKYQDYVTVVLQEMRYLSAHSYQEVVRVRDNYEEIWRQELAIGQAEGLIRTDVDIHLLRLLGFGAMNWVPIWYRPNYSLTPDAIADGFVNFMVKGVVSEPFRKWADNLN